MTAVLYLAWKTLDLSILKMTDDHLPNIDKLNESNWSEAWIFQNFYQLISANPKIQGKSSIYTFCTRKW